MRSVPGSFDPGLQEWDRPVVSNQAPAHRFQLYEYAYYVILFYATLNSTLGIAIPYVGTSMLFLLAILCLLRQRLGMLAILRPIVRPLACIVSYVFVERVIHGESINDVIPFLAWGAHLIIIQAIVSRPGFMYRFSFLTFLIGAAVIPYMSLRGTNERVGLSSSSAISNPNNLAAWFGFCAIYFLIRALQSSRLFDQLLAGFIAFVSLLIVGLTVSRSALVAITLSAIVIFRKQLRRGFMPVFAVAVLVAAGFAFGAFDNVIDHYVARGTEDSGRGSIIRPVWLRIQENPLVGVGVSHMGTVAEDGEVRFPHNSLLFFALVSGMFPFLFFIWYVASTLRAAFRVPEAHPYAPYIMPLLVYCIFFFFVHDSVFTYAFVVASFTLCRFKVKTVPRSSPVQPGFFDQPPMPSFSR